MVVTLMSLILLLVSAVTAEAWVRPGILNTTAQYDLMRQKVAAGEQPWKGAHQAMPTWLTRTPQAKASYHITSDPSTSIAFGADFGVDSMAAYASALHWIVTGQSTHVNKAKEIINDYVNTTTSITTQGDAQKFHVAWFSIYWLETAEILAHYGNSGWSTADQNAFTTWIDTVVRPHWLSAGSSTNQNHASNKSGYHISARIAWGVWTQNTSYYNAAVDMMKHQIRYYIGACGHTNIFEGYCAETCRIGNTVQCSRFDGGDLGHVHNTINHFVAGAEIVKHQGTHDLYGYIPPGDGWGIRTVFLGHAPFHGYPNRPGSSLATWPCNQGPYSQNGTPTRSMAPWRTLYNHYGNEIFRTLDNYWGSESWNFQYQRGMAMPWARLTHNYAGQVPDPDPGDPPPPPPPEGLSVAYASPTGSGTDCTQASPCTFATAASRLAAGGTLNLVSGTHVGCDDCLPSGTQSQPTIVRSVSRSGSATLVGLREVPVNFGLATITGDTGVALRLGSTAKWIRFEGVNFTTTGAGSVDAVRLLGQDITFRDVTISAPTRSANNGACLKGYPNATARVTVERSRIHDCGPTPDYDTGTYHGILAQGTGWTIIDSDVENIHGQGITQNRDVGVAPSSNPDTANDGATIRNVRIRNTGDRGLFVGATTSSTVERVLVSHTGLEGIFLSATCLRCLVHNVSVYEWSKRAGQTQEGIGVNSGTGVSSVVRNAILVGSKGVPVDIQSSTSQTACSHILTNAATLTSKCSNGLLNGVATDIWVDPANADPLLADYTLKAGSAAIDAGTTGVCTDADVGANRCTPARTLSTFTGAGVDLGALESDAPAIQQTVSFWPLTANANDTVGPNNGTPTGIVFNGTAAEFNADSDVIQIPLAGLPIDRFTLAIDARTTSLSGRRFMFGHTSNPPNSVNMVKFYLDEGVLEVGLGNTHESFRDTVPWELNTWHRVVLIVENGMAKIFDNGSLRGTMTYNNLTTWGSFANLGNAGAVGLDPVGWRGELRNALMANYAWSAADVTADCQTYCAEAPPPFDPLECVSAIFSPGATSGGTVTCTASGSPDPADCATASQFTLAVNRAPEDAPSAFSTATSATFTDSQPPICTLAFPDAPGSTDQIELVRTEGDEQSVWPVVYEPETPTFDPMIFRDGQTDESCLTITATVEGRPNPTQNLGDFIVRDNCDNVVPLTGYSLAHGGTTSTLTIHRSVPCDSENTAILLGFIPTNQTIGIVNNFAPGAGATTGMTQVAFRCRADALTTLETWLGGANLQCRPPSPGRLNLRVALHNGTGGNLDAMVTGLFVARKEVGQSWGTFARVGEGVNSASALTQGVWYPGVGLTSSLPDQTLLLSAALNVSGATYAPVGLARKRPTQVAYPTIADDHWWEEEHTVVFDRDIPIGTEFCFQVRRQDGASLESYSPSLSDCEGALIRIGPPRWIIR